MNHRQSLNRLVVLAVLVGSLGAGLPAAHAASYTWTNTANTASDFWTNGVKMMGPQLITILARRCPAREHPR